MSDVAIAGAAAAQTTTLITNLLAQPAQETTLTLTTHAISLTGTGSQYSNFTWSDLVIQMAMPCAQNQNQNQTISGVILPVRWLGFTATGGVDKISAQWIVASEENTANYELQLRNTDGSFATKTSFQKDATKRGNYSGDIAQLAAGTYFVRIKSNERDGSVLYSEVKRVVVGSTKNTVILYPNPVKGGSALLQFTPSEKVTYTALVIDATGRTVKQQVLSGLQIGQGNTVTLQLQGLQTGVYRLRIVGGSDEMVTTIHIAR